MAGERPARPSKTLYSSNFFIPPFSARYIEIYLDVLDVTVSICIPCIENRLNLDEWTGSDGSYGGSKWARLIFR